MKNIILSKIFFISILYSLSLIFLPLNLIAAPSGVTTEGTSSITKNSVIFNGSTYGVTDAVNSRGFEYGLDENYGENISEDGPFDPNDNFSLEVNSLDCETTYHFRAYKVTRLISFWYGSDNTFTTGTCESTRNRHRSSGSSASSIYSNLISMGNTSAAQNLLEQFPTQINPSIVDNSKINEIPKFFNKVLRHGMSGDDIKSLQEYLNEKGYESGLSDGVFGPKTKQAVIKFQLANGLVGDGVVGPKTIALIK